jgi:dTDP-4-amino-4,6-dideoxygalactose transaminase
MYADQFDACPESAKASEEVLSLPLHLRLVEDDIRRICEAVKEGAVAHTA